MNLRLIAATLVFGFGVLLGGVALSEENDPPAVQPGTAKWNCERIVQAGYSPYDYIYQVRSFESFRSKTLNYEHHYTVQGGSLVVRNPTGTPFWNVIKSQTNDNGVLRRWENGQFVPLGTGQGSGDADAYEWTPVGGPPVIFRDQYTTFYSVESDWVHQPGWDGPGDARMSSIWGAVAECMVGQG